MTIITDFDFFDTVYIKTDPDQRARQITEMEVKPGSLIIYFCQCGESNTPHYAEELTREPNILTKVQ